MLITTPFPLLIMLAAWMDYTEFGFSPGLCGRGSSYAEEMGEGQRAYQGNWNVVKPLFLTELLGDRMDGLL